ncbi:uncharacterized protein AUP68_17416 [Ilyonectria robusta]
MSGDAGFTHGSEVYPYYHNNRVNPNDTMMDEATSKSIYKPLDVAKEEVRLLVLHPPLVADSTLRCTLLHTGFASPSIDAPTVPSYEALSYVWGDPNFCMPIWLNNKEVWVTPNLAYALSTLRLQGGDRVLWVDALCINQLDIAERAHQVTLMRKIYSRCQRDLAWVGPTLDIDCSEEDFDYYQLMIAKAMKLMDRIVHRDAQTLMSLEGRYKSRKGARAPGTSETTMQVDRRETRQLNWLIKELCFWERVWIVQELSCAPRLTLVCDGAELEWEALSLFLRDEPYFDAFHAVGDLYGLTSNHHIFRECFVNVKMIEDQRERVQACLDKGHAADGSSSTLIDVLARFRRMKSTDPRDRIYALLGLVTQDHGIKVDYTKSIRDLYQEVTVSLINLSGNLDAICQSPFELTKGPLALCAPGDRALSPSRGSRAPSPFQSCLRNATYSMQGKRDAKCHADSLATVKRHWYSEVAPWDASDTYGPKMFIVGSRRRKSWRIMLSKMFLMILVVIFTSRTSVRVRQNYPKLRFKPSGAPWPGIAHHRQGCVVY